jgi:hypothetical protein
MKERVVIKVGTVVRLKKRKRTARVVAMLRDVKGGVLLSKTLGGFNYWNVKDLERASDSANEGQ